MILHLLRIKAIRLNTYSGRVDVDQNFSLCKIFLPSEQSSKCLFEYTDDIPPLFYAQYRIRFNHPIFIKQEKKITWPVPS
jgi:hypothetical protein